MKKLSLLMILIVLSLGFTQVANASTPSVSSINPSNGANNIFLDVDITIGVENMNPDPNRDDSTGVRGESLNMDTVFLYKASDGESAKVPATYNTSGGGDIIVVSPIQPELEPNTVYTLKLTSGVTDTTGAGFDPFTATFTTGTAIQFSPSSATFTAMNSGAPTAKYSSLVFGPDHRLYASTTIMPDFTGGRILVFNVNASTGELILAHTINALAGRTVIGLAVDPTSTPDNPILWATSNDPGYSNAPNFTGKIHRLTVTGHNTAAEAWTQQEKVIGLPRSVKDHLSNSLAFGADGKMYMNQGSITAMGAPDSNWGWQPETMLSAAVLQIDTVALAARTEPVNVRTGITDAQGKLNNSSGNLLPGAANYGLGDPNSPYNPLAPNAPVKIFATGVRNAYDLVWHTNGQLYVPTNGSANGGNTPGTPTGFASLVQCQNRVNGTPYTAPAVPGLTNVDSKQRDYLFRVVQNGYYGHPNPVRCEWVLNGGNGTLSNDKNRVAEYTPNVEPDPNYRSYAHEFDYNKSPNGVIEYKSSAFKGALKNRLLVVRYSSNDDILVLTPGGPTDDFNITGVGTSIKPTGITWNNPLDLVEDVRTGNLYVSMYRGEASANVGDIALLKPAAGQGVPVVGDETIGYPEIAFQPNTLELTDAVGGGGSPVTPAYIRNTGAVNLTLNSIELGGIDADQFEIVAKPYLPMLLAPGQSVAVTVRFTLTSRHDKSAQLVVNSSDPETPNVEFPLVGVDAVPNTVPNAVARSFQTNRPDAITVSAANGVLKDLTDADGDTLVARLVTDVSHGTLDLNANGRFTYTPNPNFNGVDTFVYDVYDGYDASAPAAVAITVNAVPVASNAYYVAITGQALNVNAANGLAQYVVDDDAQAVTFAVTDNVNHGTLNVNATTGAFTYTATSGFGGSDTFRFTASDSTATSGEATVTITVRNAPVASSLNFSTTEDTALNVAQGEGLFTGISEGDADTMTVTVVTNPQHGTVNVNTATGAFLYTPNANFNGTDSFTYRATDAYLSSAPAAVTITVSAVNDAPVAVNDSYSTPFNQPLTVAAPGVLTNDRDVDGDTLTVTVNAQPTLGTVQLAANGGFTYTPAGTVGADSFTYTVTDGNGLTAAATAAINVTERNTVPVVANDTYTTSAGTALTVAAPGVLANDTDADGDTLTATINALPTSGVVELAANGGFIYTPNAGVTGTDSFGYTATDSKGGTAQGTVTITINAVSVNMLANASFESTTNGKLPDGWKVKQQSGDKLVCNKPGKTIAVEGNCAFKFKAKANESAKLMQKFKLVDTAQFATPLGLRGAAGETLTLTAQVQSKKLISKKIALVTVQYADKSLGKDTRKLKVGVKDSAGSYQLVTSKPLVLKGETKRIKVEFFIKGTKGKYVLDDAKLMLAPAGIESLGNVQVPFEFAQ